MTEAIGSGVLSPAAPTLSDDPHQAVGRPSAMARTVLFMVQLYRTWVSPLRLPTCRYVPTCSEYAIDAVTDYGAIRGGAMALRRLLKCGPWSPGGADPVPLPKPKNAAKSAATLDDSHQHSSAMTDSRSSGGVQPSGTRGAVTVMKERGLEC